MIWRCTQWSWILKVDTNAAHVWSDETNVNGEFSLVVLHLQPGEVERYPGPFVCIVQSLAGVHPLCVPLKLLYDQSRAVDGHLHPTQVARLRLQLWALSVVVSHRYVVISAWFGESPDEDGWNGGPTVQDDRASHCRCSMGANVFHLLRVKYLQTCNTRQPESVTITVRKGKLSCCCLRTDKNSPNKLSIDRWLLVSPEKFCKTSQFVGNGLRQLLRMSNT